MYAHNRPVVLLRVTGIELEQAFLGFIIMNYDKDTATYPLVSIVLTTYNRAHLLPRAIDSVLMQHYESWELLLVDDGSQDETPALLRTLTGHDARIRTFRHSNRGPAASRNAGMREVRGEFLTFLDSDDEYLAEHLYLRVAFMLAHPEVHFIHGGVVVEGSEAEQLVPDVNDTTRRIHIDRCAVGGTFFARRGVIEKAGGWRPGYGEDADLFERIERLFTVRRIDVPTYLYHRDTADSRCTLHSTRL